MRNCCLWSVNDIMLCSLPIRLWTQRSKTHILKKVSEYDQKIPQSHKANQPMATVRKSHRTFTAARHLGSRLLCLIVSLSLSHWYPGSGVLLDCIDS